MADFSDRMKSFTENLRGSIQTRGEALVQVHAITGQLLGDARSFLKTVADEQHEKADELHETLASQRKECSENVAEMRQGHQDSLRTMRDDLNQMLSETRKARQDSVEEMTETFQQARQELADDLQQASNAWREFAARVEVKAAPAEHRRADSSQPHPAASEHAGRHSKRNPSNGKRAKSGRP